MPLADARGSVTAWEAAPALLNRDCEGATRGLFQRPAKLKAKKLTEGEREAKKMLLMETDKSGKVSKQAFMSFVEPEFERIDVNKDGELDVKELEDSRVQVRTRGR